MRLTDYCKEHSYYTPTPFVFNSKEDTIMALCKKLGQLEDIEDELGIDLITFFKFLSSKVCYEKDTDDNETTKCLITGITKTGVLNVPEAFPYGECEREAKFKDYGVTWALTKKELL